MTPEISIILPTHNGSGYLAASIQSCLEQTFGDFELVVVDDASSDSTPRILEGFAAEPRVRILRSEQNLKLPGALNMGFAQARGRLLTWTSDDNLYEPGALEALRRVLVERPGIDLVYADYSVIDPEGRVMRQHGCSDPDYMVERNCVGACFMYRRSVMERVGPYETETFLAEDYDFFLRTFLAGLRMHHLAEVLYRYRVHEASLGSTFGAGQVDEVAEAVRRRHLKPWKREWVRLRRRVRKVLGLLRSS